MPISYLSPVLSNDRIGLFYFNKNLKTIFIKIKSIELYTNAYPKNSTKGTGYKNIDKARLIYEVARKLTHHLIDSLLSQTRNNIKTLKIETESDIRNLGRPLVEFTENTVNEVKLIKDFLFRKVYRHHRVVAVTLQCQNIIKSLFKLYAENINLLPFSWRQMIKDDVNNSEMSIIADYIAGMTDRYAIKQYQSFYNLKFANADL